MRYVQSLIAAAILLSAATAANAEFIGFDDSAAGKLTVGVSGFALDYLDVNGVTFVSPNFEGVFHDFAKGATLNFAGTFSRAVPATDEDSTYLFVTAANPLTVVAELRLNRSAVSGMKQQIDGTYWGIGSGHSFSALGTGTTFQLTSQPNNYPYNQTPVLGWTNVIDTNLALLVATPGAAAVPEPASWAMMIGGLGLVGASLRRRKAAVSFA